jgi:hypothetical protein
MRTKRGTAKERSLICIVAPLKQERGAQPNMHWLESVLLFFSTFIADCLALFPFSCPVCPGEYGAIDCNGQVGPTPICSTAYAEDGSEGRPLAKLVSRHRESSVYSTAFCDLVRGRRFLWHIDVAQRVFTVPRAQGRPA